MTASSGRMRTIALILGVALSVGAIALVVFLRRPPSPPELALPDLTHFDGEVAAAIEAAYQQTQAEPYSINAWSTLAMTFQAHFLVPQAEMCFEYLCLREPEAGKWWHLRGYLHETIDLEFARTCYQRAVHDDPDYLASHMRLARVLVRLGEVDASIAELREALAQSPRNPHVSLELARMLIERGELEEARQLLTTACDQPGWYARPAYVALAQVCTRLEDLDAATAAYQQAMSMPEATDAMADPYLSEVQQHEALGRGFSEQADLYAAQGRWQQAASAYERIIARSPDLVGPRLNLAHAYLMLGQYDGAITTAREAGERFPGNPNAAFMLATIYHTVGEVQLALEAYEKCCELGPTNAVPWFNKGLLLESTDELDLALEAYRQAVLLEPSHAPSQLALGVLLRKLGRPAEALPYLRNAVILVPGDPVPEAELQAGLEAAEAVGP